MPKPFPILFAAAVVAYTMLASGAPAQAQRAARGTMEQCVDRVLDGLRKQATDIEVGRAIVTQCDSQLRATLAEAIRSGEASSCTVEKCIQIARDEASREAKELYRKRKEGGR